MRSMVWQIPDAVCAVLSSWWWTEKPKHVERLTEINKSEKSCILLVVTLKMQDMRWTTKAVSFPHPRASLTTRRPLKPEDWICNSVDTETSKYLGFRPAGRSESRRTCSRTNASPHNPVLKQSVNSPDRQLGACRGYTTSPADSSDPRLHVLLKCKLRHAGFWLSDCRRRFNVCCCFSKHWYAKLTSWLIVNG